MNRWQRFTSATILAWAAIAGGAGSAAAQTKPEGEMRFALYVTVAPAWLDPAEAGPGFGTPFWIIYGAARRAGEADARKSYGSKPR